MSNQLITEPPLYTPQFNAVTGKYEDQSPYEKYKPTHKIYKCSCKSGTLFSDRFRFMQHIKSKTHQEYINNYENYNKELIALKKENINLRAAYLLLEQKNTKLDRALDARCVEVLNLEKNKEELMMIKKVFKLLTH